MSGCKCAGVMTIIAGAIVLLNVWFVQINLGILLGALLILAGLFTLMRPSCCNESASCCAEQKPAEAPVEKPAEPIVQAPAAPVKPVAKAKAKPKKA